VKKVRSLFFNDKQNVIRNREEWLTRLLILLRPFFAKIGHPLPDHVRVTCGWPSKGGLSRSRRTVGECWPPAASDDGSTEIFISPCLGDALQVAETVVHEAVHATGAMGHRKSFSRIARAIGLRRPWRATRATLELRARLNGLISKIGPYPHATLNAELMPHKKDSTRLLKLFCPEDGYIVRTTEKWISVGMPLCPCGTRMERAPSQDFADLKPAE
jgi:hypothetical protein